MKRFTALVIVLMMLVALVPAAFAEETVTLDFLYWADDVQTQLLTAACKAYEDANPGVKINAQALPADGTFDSYIQTRMASNQLPDVSYMGESDIMKYDKMGILADISDLIASGAIPEKLSAVTIRNADGKVIGVGLSNQLVVLYYNKDKFDQANLAYPPSDVKDAWDWDTFVNTAKKLTVDANGKNATEEGFDPTKIMEYGLGFNCLREFHQFWAMYANNGGVVSADGKDFLWDSDKSAQGLQKLVDLMHVDHVAPQALYNWASDIGSVRDAINGGFAMFTNGSWDLANITPDDHIGVGVLPKMEKAVTMNCGAPMVVYNTSKHIDEAKKFYAYMVDPAKNLPLLQSGAWLPNQANWYTDESLISQWADKLPFGAKETILSYSNTEGSIAQWPAYYVLKYQDMSTLYEKEIDNALMGNETVAEAFAKCMPGIKDAFTSK